MSDIFQCSNLAERLHSALSINKDLKSMAPCHAVGCYSLTVSFKLSGFWQLLSQAMPGKSAQGQRFSTADEQQVLRSTRAVLHSVSSHLTSVTAQVFCSWAKLWRRAKDLQKVSVFPPYYFVGHKEGPCMRKKEMSCSRAGQEVSSVLNILNTAMGLLNPWSCSTGGKRKMLGRDFRLTINWKSNSKRKS